MGSLKLIFFLVFFLRILIVKSEETAGSKSESGDSFVYLYWFFPTIDVQGDVQPTQVSENPLDEDVPRDQNPFDDIHYDDLPMDRQYDFDQLPTIKVVSSSSSSESLSSAESRSKSKFASGIKSSASSESSSTSAERKKQRAIDSQIFWHFMRLLDGPSAARDSDEKLIPKKETESEEVEDKKYSEIKTSTLVKKPTEFKKKYVQFEKTEPPTQIEKKISLEASEQTDSSDDEIQKSNIDKIVDEENSSSESSAESRHSESHKEKDENKKDRKSTNVPSEPSTPVEKHDDSVSITDYEKPIFVPLAPYEDEQSSEETENKELYFIEPLTPALLATKATPSENDESEHKSVAEITKDRSEKSEDDKKESSELMLKPTDDLIDSTIDENKAETIPETGSVPSVGIKSMPDRHSEENEISQNESDASDKQEQGEVTDDKAIGHISLARLLKKYFLGIPL